MSEAAMQDEQIGQDRVEPETAVEAGEETGAAQELAQQLAQLRGELTVARADKEQLIDRLARLHSVPA